MQAIPVGNWLTAPISMYITQDKKFSRDPYQSGFTLIEIMLAITIAGILAMMAIPEMNYAMDNSRVRTATSDIHTTLLLARSEAIKRNGSITINRGGAAWTDGWEVKTGSTILPNGKQEAIGGVDILCFTNTAGSTPCGATLTFERTGRSSSYIEFRMYNSTDTNIPMRCVKVSLSGRPGSSVDSDNNAADGCD